VADKVIQLSVKVNSDTGQLEVLGAKFKGAASSAKDAEGAFKGLKGEASSLLQSFLPFATAGGILAFFTSSVKAAEQENQSLQRLKFTVESMGGSWEKAKDQVAAWGTAIAATTRFSDGDAFNAIDRLARITGSLTSAQKAAQVAMGLSVSSGKSLNETTELMSNLLAGNERALMETKREFGAFAGSAQNAQQALDLLSARFGDAAFKEESFTKETNQLKNAFGEFQEQVGRGLIPALIPVFDVLSMIMRGFRELGVVIAGMGASFLAFAESLGSATMKLAKMDFSGAKAEAKNLGLELKTIAEETAASVDEIEAERDRKSMARSSEAVNLKAIKGKQEISAAEEEAKKLAEIEADLGQKMAAIGEDTFAKKRAVMQAELAAQRTKINNELKTEVDKAKALEKLKELELKQTHEMNRLEVRAKTAAALEIVDLSLQTLNILNSMGESHSKAEVTRAKVILALEKAIAIARAISEAQKGGPFAAGIAAASIALITTQFAQQSKAIDQAAAQARAGNEQFTISTPLPGTGSSLEQTFGQGAGAPAAAAGPVGTGLAAAPSTGGGGSGTTVINVGGVNLSLIVDKLDISNVRVVAQALADLAKGGVVEGVQLAVVLKNVGEKNAGLAV
jgi:hypothetical protein